MSNDDQYTMEDFEPLSINHMLFCTSCKKPLGLSNRMHITPTKAVHTTCDTQNKNTEKLLQTVNENIGNKKILEVLSVLETALMFTSKKNQPFTITEPKHNDNENNKLFTCIDNLYKNDVGSRFRDVGEAISIIGSKGINGAVDTKQATEWILELFITNQAMPYDSSKGTRGWHSNEFVFMTEYVVSTSMLMSQARKYGVKYSHEYDTLFYPSLFLSVFSHAFPKYLPLFTTINRARRKLQGQDVIPKPDLVKQVANKLSSVYSMKFTSSEGMEGALKIIDGHFYAPKVGIYIQKARIQLKKKLCNIIDVFKGKKPVRELADYYSYAYNWINYGNELCNENSENNTHHSIPRQNTGALSKNTYEEKLIQYLGIGSKQNIDKAKTDKILKTISKKTDTTQEIIDAYAYSNGWLSYDLSDNILAVFVWNKQFAKLILKTLLAFWSKGEQLPSVVDNALKTVATAMNMYSYYTYKSLLFIPSKTLILRLKRKKIEAINKQ